MDWVQHFITASTVIIVKTALSGWGLKPCIICQIPKCWLYFFLVDKLVLSHTGDSLVKQQKLNTLYTGFCNFFLKLLCLQ